MSSIRLFVIASIVSFTVLQSISANTYDAKIKPLLTKYCLKCHGAGDELSGEVDFSSIVTSEQIDASFEVWKKAIHLIADGAMPPEDEPQPSATEEATIESWYQQRFVQSVEAHPGFFRPRRLAAYEYRNTLHSVLGFKLEVAIREAEQTIAEKSLVMKLLQTDPPGPSGFTNDTSGNPLTTVLWDQYSYLVDNSLDRLFSSQHRDSLETLAGKINGKYLTNEQAGQVLRRIARRAHRRSVEASTLVESIAALNAVSGETLEAALRVELKTVLMSPAFIYRGLLMEGPRDTVTQVDNFELAERLSYFLWADMPDEELMQFAEEKTLSDPDVFNKQIDRMLASPESRSLASDLGVQWFSLNEIDKVSDNVPIADALKTQPLDFLHYLFTDSRPLIELVAADTTFINPHTAKYYPRDRKQMKNYRKQKGIEFERVPNQKIKLLNTPERGGLLTMPGVLAMNKGPVLRGMWILERVLGDHLPEPPGDVGQVQSNKPGENLTFRERFESHRTNATCAICHDKIDPLGFGLGAYDASGGFTKSESYAPKKPKARKKDRIPATESTSQIDTSGRLPTGETFEDFEDLKQILVSSQREVVIRNIVRRTMSYALCRKLELYDQPTVEDIVKDLNENDGTFNDLIHLIASSLPFQKTVVTNK